MKLVDKSITVAELLEMSKKMHEGLVKAVVDVEKEIMVVDAGLHADQELFLLENESDQENLWGINVYPEKFGSENWIEFDSMINVRPPENMGRGVNNLSVQKKITSIVNKLVSK